MIKWRYHSVDFWIGGENSEIVGIADNVNVGWRIGNVGNVGIEQSGRDDGSLRDTGMYLT